MIVWEMTEREAVRDFLNGNGPLKRALEKFCASKTAETEGSCADAMRSVPRRFEHGADYAAQAGVYERFLGELASEAARKV